MQKILITGSGLLASELAEKFSDSEMDIGLFFDVNTISF